jgi:hypothetical protein
MSSVVPWRQLAKVGDARSVLRAAASSRRALGEECLQLERADVGDRRGGQVFEQGAELGGLSGGETALGEHG